MKYFHLIIKTFFVILLFCTTTFAQNKRTSSSANDSQLAYRFYQAKDFEKAAPLFKRVYDQSGFKNYFDLYIQCTLGMMQYDKAEKEAKKEFRKRKSPEYEVTLGYVYESSNKMDLATQHFNQAVSNPFVNKNQVVLVANAFYSYRKYEWALTTYEKGTESLTNESFFYERARIYRRMKDYGNMIQTYLQYLSVNPKALRQVQSQFQNSLAQDIDGEIKDLLKRKIVTSIQQNPNSSIYQEMLMWFFMQNHQYSKALEQAIALDRRTGDKRDIILRLADASIEGNEFISAIEACDYLLGKQNTEELTKMFEQKRLQYSYQQYLTIVSPTAEENENMLNLFQSFSSDLSITSKSSGIYIDYSKLLLFSFDRPKEAKNILESLLLSQRLNKTQLAKVKMNLAQIAIYTGDFYEANFLYSQVNKENKGGSFADEAKLAKAKLGIYMGNFAWAQASLDVLKASTSKLIANDAMDLSQLLKNNVVETDSVNTAFQLYSNAERQLFCNRLDSALLSTDEIITNYKSNSIVPEALFQKSKILSQQSKFAESQETLRTIFTKFPFSRRADDAMFVLAEQLRRTTDGKTEALELYKQIITEHSGSIFTPQARQLYNENK